MSGTNSGDGREARREPAEQVAAGGGRVDRPAVREPGGSVATRAGTSAAGAGVSAEGADAERAVRRSLTFGTELRRQLGRRRTAWAFGLTLALPVLVAGAFLLGDDGRPGANGPRFSDLATSGAPNFAVFVLFASAQILLLILAALFTGDPVPSEASWGSLRYLLAAPVPRTRLLASKLAVGLVTTLVVVALLPAWSLLVGGVVFGWEPFTNPAGGSLTWAEFAPRLALAVGYVFVLLLPAALLAFCLGVLTDAPLAAVGGAVLAAIVCGILDSLDALGDLRHALPLHYLDTWLTLLTTDPDRAGLVHGLLWSLLWSAALAALAVVLFRRKDVLS